MKKLLVTGCALSLLANVAYATAPETTPVINSEQDKVSYTLGYDMGNNFRNHSIVVEPKLFTQGLVDGMNNNQAAMSSQAMEETLMNFQKQLLINQAKQVKEVGTENAKAGADFLAKNKTQKGVVTLPSGLQYKIIKPGKGASPTADSVVTVDYAGRFINGEEFDSSYKRGEPTTFPVSEVIQGWQEALKLMKPGATWEIYVPSNLAYGERVVGPVGPNETLIFTIHLIK